MRYNIGEVVDCGGLRGKMLNFRLENTMGNRILNCIPIREENGSAKEVRRMLCGEYKHAIDAKNRLFIPAKYREQLGESFIVIRGSEGDERFLTVYSQDEWKEIEAKLASMPRSSTRGLNRFWGRNGLEATPDSQGRILLSPSLVEYVGFGKSAVIIGCGSYLEIWSEEGYERMVAAEDEAAMEQQMKELGF